MALHYYIIRIPVNGILFQFTIIFKMNKMKIFLSLILVAFLNQALFSQSQGALNEEICDDMVTVEKELENVVEKIRKKYYNDTLFLNKLEISQKSWIKYRESQIELKFPAKDKYFEYGSLYPTCYCLEKIKITELRIQDLKMWVNGVIEGNVCPGSVLIEQE